MESKKKMGRPTTEPKTISVRIRLSDNDDNMLKFCAEKLNKTKADIIRMGIEQVYKSLK